MVSVVAVLYQKVTACPEAETLIGWKKAESPFGSLVPEAVPNSAQYVPLCGAAVVTVGAGTDAVVVQPVRFPDSNPPLVTWPTADADIASPAEHVSATFARVFLIAVLRYVSAPIRPGRIPS